MGRPWASLFLAVFLAACGGGGGGSTGSAPAAVPPPTEAEAGRLLSQATFGATDADIGQVRATTIEAWIRSQISAPVSTPGHQAFLETRLAELRQASPTAQLSPDLFYDSWWRTAVNGPDQLRQRVAFAYSQIFVISVGSDVIDPRGAGAYYDMLTANAFGNYRDLLQAVTLHPMMGRYLTYLGNVKEDAAGTRTPDENYAREVMQLMTIGLFQLNADGTQSLDLNGRPIPAYGPADISGLAKVFTGLSWYSQTPTNTTFLGGARDPDAAIRPMIFYPQHHSTSQKSFLGVTIPASTTVASGSGQV